MRNSLAHLVAILWTAAQLLDPAVAFTRNVPTSRILFSSSELRRQSTRVDATTTATTTTTSPTTTESGGAQRTMSKLARENDVILYDGICVFCNSWVDLLLRIDVNQKFRFAPLQSRVGQELLVSIGKQADDISSVVLIKARTGESYDKSRCVLKVVEELGPVAALASRAALMVVPESIRDGIYDTVAENRYNLMGKRDECRCSDPQFADRFLLD